MVSFFEKNYTERKINIENIRTLFSQTGWKNIQAHYDGVRLSSRNRLHRYKYVVIGLKVHCRYTAILENYSVADGKLIGEEAELRAAFEFLMTAAVLQ